VMMLGGALAAALAGLVVGLTSLRLKGDYLAIVTLGFGEIIRIVVQNQAAIGGSYGMNVQPKFPTLFASSGTSGLWMVWLLAIVTIAVSRNLLKNVHGLPFLAVREDEVASSAMGVNVTGVKVIAFLLGSAFAGAAGALLAHYEGFISPTMFTMELSFIVLTMVVLGGTGSVTGSTIAAIALFYLPEKLRDMSPVPVSFLIGGAVGAVAMVVTMKWISNHYHGPKLKGVLFYLSAVAGGIFITVLFGKVLPFIPLIGNAAPVEANKLRMVIFALTLIFLMLLRPQGVFGHHEFSWSWVKKLMGKKDVPTTAVSA
jgi:branched-chain amino acid transport system permease protein